MLRLEFWLGLGWGRRGRRQIGPRVNTFLAGLAFLFSFFAVLLGQTLKHWTAVVISK